MRKLWLVMLVAGAVAALSACSSEEGEDSTPVNPVTDYSVPPTAAIGGKMTVKGKGFDSAAQIALKGTNNIETLAEELTAAATGVEFTVPATLTEGIYKVILKQKGNWELGSVRLSAPNMPIMSLSLPTTIKLNEKLKIDGIGFTAAMKIFLEKADASKTRKELTVSLSSSGVECTIPSGTEAGSYKVFLQHNSHEWEIGGPIEAAVYKRLVGFKKIAKQLTDISDFDAIAAANPDHPTLPMYIAQLGADAIKQMLSGMDGERVSQNSYVYNNDKQLVTINTGSGEAMKSEFTLTHNDNKISGVYDLFDPESPGIKSFELTANGDKVASSTAVYSSSSGPDRNNAYTWNYAEGFFTGLTIASNGNEYQIFTRESGNFVGLAESGVTQKIIKYDAQSKKNNIFAADVAIYFAQVDPAVTVANILSMMGKNTSILPVSAVGPDMTTGGVKDLPLTYTFDNDGYVTSVEWGDQSLDGMFQLFPFISSSKLEFVYE